MITTNNTDRMCIWR